MSGVGVPGKSTGDCLGQTERCEALRSGHAPSVGFPGAPAPVWRCADGCRPHVGRMARPRGVLVVLVHGIECTLPVAERPTVILRFEPGREAGQARSAGSPARPVASAGLPDQGNGARAGRRSRRPSTAAPPGPGVGQPDPVPENGPAPTDSVPELAPQGSVGAGTTTGA